MKFPFALQKVLVICIVGWLYDIIAGNMIIIASKTITI